MEKKAKPKATIKGTKLIMERKAKPIDVNANQILLDRGKAWNSFEKSNFTLQFIIKNLTKSK